MTDHPDYIRVTASAPPDPPAQDRVIRSEIIHSMPAGVPMIWLGEAPPVDLVSNLIEVSLEHSF